MKRTRKFILFIAFALIFLLIAAGLCFGTETFPTKPSQVVVLFAPGGSNDVLARSVANILPK